MGFNFGELIKGIGIEHLLSKHGLKGALSLFISFISNFILTLKPGLIINQHGFSFILKGSDHQQIR